MSKNFKINLCFFSVLLLTVFLSALLPYLSIYAPQKLNRLNINNGKVNLSDYNTDNGDVAYLTGEWEFYWQKFLVTNHLKNAHPDLIVHVPSPWTTYKINGKHLQNGGYASYRAVVTGFSAADPVIINVPNLAAAYRVFIDGVCVFSSGNVSAVPTETASNMYFSPIPLFSLGNSKSGTHEIVIEVSCAYTSGLTASPTLCSYHTYQSHNSGAVALRFLLIGAVVFFALIAVIYNRTIKDGPKIFWLIVLCVSLTLRMLICNEGYMVAHNIFLNLDYEIMNSLIYVSTYIIKLALFMHVVTSLRLKVPQYVLIMTSVLFLMCAAVPYFLYNYIYISSLYLTLQSVPYLLDIYMIYKLSEAITNKKRYALFYLIAYCVMTIGIVIDSYYLCGYIAANVSMLMPIACFIFIIIMIFIHTLMTVKVYSDAKKTAVLSKQLADANMTLMLSQIQPHFLYNALNTIKYLTKKDPKAAEEAIVKFSSYLRANMDSLSEKGFIPFTKELDHVRNYAYIEQLRFGDRLNIEYDIQCQDFGVPPLVIQPLVENAIKHGVNQRTAGGTVKIITREDEHFRYITVKDDGIGFDPSAKPSGDGSHVGIKNITSRLKEMLSATVAVTSIPGEGTAVTITIPKTDEK